MASQKDKFVIRIPRPDPPFKSQLVRIPAETYLRILDVQHTTGLTQGEIIDKCTAFALDRLVILREEEV